MVLVLTDGSVPSDVTLVTDGGPTCWLDRPVLIRPVSLVCRTRGAVPLRSRCANGHDWTTTVDGETAAWRHRDVTRDRMRHAGWTLFPPVHTEGACLLSVNNS